MHRAAKSSREAVILGEKLGHEAVKEELLGYRFDGLLLGVFLDDLVKSAALDGLHYLDKLLVGELFDSRHALGYDFVVRAVGAEDEVVLVEEIGFADGGGFLAYRKVRGAGIGEGLVVVVGFELDGLEHGLEFADGEHVLVDAEKIRFGVVTFGDFLFDGLLVLADRDVLEGDGAGLVKGSVADVL